MSAAYDGNANSAEHKVYAFASRLIKQYGIVAEVEREFDRVVRVTLQNGNSIRIGMIPDYEPTADNVRSFWKAFGPVDIAWNINPNGFPCDTAKKVGGELGCEVLKTEGMKSYLQTL
jgi:alpha-glucuronidase